MSQINYQKYLEQFPDQTSAICRAESSGKLAHAYIVYSDNLQIREDYSLLLAQIAACPNSSDTGIPCFTCSVCRQLTDLSYAELFSLMPNKKSRQIGIGENEYDLDTMRWFQAQFYMSSVSPGRRKIGIIYDTDCLTQQAQNAFLKTLEEPPANTVFILNTANPKSLLPTIISRCHTLTLLENVCDYNFKGAQDMIQTLFRLQACTANHLSVGSDSADELIKISKDLNNQAKERVLPKWEKRLADAENPDLKWSAGQRKRIKERSEGAVAAEYLRLRKIFLSLIHTWFAQSYELACGVDFSSLPNQELYQHIDVKKFHLDEEAALSNLKKAETLIQNLNWNVQEELAIREFACSFTA